MFHIVLLSDWYFFVFFFFSSRRRHTRYIGDWSSDVCSSDLDLLRFTQEQLVERFGKWGTRLWELARGIDESPVEPNQKRSEERRVGKEGRWRREAEG